MNKPNKALVIAAFLLSQTLPACGGEVTYEQVPEEVDCDDCQGLAHVELTSLDWLSPGDPDLDIDLCVGVSCGQTLLGVLETPEGGYRDGCIEEDGEVACCSSSPVETVPECSAEPGGTLLVTVVLPLGAKPGATIPVFADVSTMTGDYVDALDGAITVRSCGDGCITASTTLR